MYHFPENMLHVFEYTLKIPLPVTLVSYMSVLAENLYPSEEIKCICWLCLTSSPDVSTVIYLNYWLVTLLVNATYIDNISIFLCIRLSIYISIHNDSFLPRFVSVCSITMSDNLLVKPEQSSHSCHLIYIPTWFYLR
jgi:hypothetical protein